MPGPLAGLHVLELATGVAGPYAGRLFAMLGATVVKVEPAGGDPARTAPVDHRPLTGISPLFLHLNAGKRNVEVEDEAALGQLLAWADVVIDDRVRQAAEGTLLDPDRLRSADSSPRLLASVTAWGFDADDAGQMGDEVVVQAASAALSETGDPGREPVRFPGWQSQYLAGGYAAATALAALGEEEFRHVDVSWVGAMMSGVESGLGTELHRPTARDDGPVRDITSGAFPAGAFRCADGHVVPGTVRPIDWSLQCEVYGRPDLIEDPRFTALTRMQNRDELMAEIQPWYDSHTKRAIFAAALEAGWAAAMVVTASDLLDDPHVTERRFLGALESGGLLPGRPWRAADIPEGEPVAVVDRGASAPPVLNGAARFAMPAPRQLKVVELTWAWAGPFIGRFLGALGADVIRIETGRYPDGWRSRVRWRDVGVPLGADADPDDITWDAAPLHNTINRNKRSLSLDLSTDDGRAVLDRLLEPADAMIVNMGHSVLVDRGIDGIVRDHIDRGLVLVQMPALGASGPYKSMPGYGTLIEGMGGLAARMGYGDEGARVTSTYYPDAVAGLHGTVALLAALGAKHNDGRGAFVDLSQQEVMWMQLGEGIVLRSTEGREPDRLGNDHPSLAPSGIYRCRDDVHVAIAVRSDDEFAVLAKSATPALDDFLSSTGEERVARRAELNAALGAWFAQLDSATAVARVRDAGAVAEPVLTYRRARREGTLAARHLTEQVEHPVTGTRTYLRVPVRIDGRLVDTARHAPVFAQHTDDVLVDWLAMDERERARLRDAEVIGTKPIRQSRRG